jgi:2-dehydropantoate 2-reductase
MYRDLKEQAPVEVDSILGDLIERGRKHGVSARIVQAAFVSLTIYQQERARCSFLTLNPTVLAR